MQVTPFDIARCASDDILAAIASSLQEDYGIADCMLFKFAQVVGLTTSRSATSSFIERGEILIVIRISDFTALCITLVPETPAGSVLFLFKIPFDDCVGDTLLLDNRKIYWKRFYELASPDDFDDVLRIITTNFDEYSEWPHRAKPR